MDDLACVRCRESVGHLAGLFAAYALAHDIPASTLSENRATATITLFAVALVVLTLVARPLAPLRIGLIAVMAGIFVVVLAVPPFAEFFALGFGYLYNTGVGLILALAAVAGLLIALPTPLRRRS